MRRLLLISTIFLAHCASPDRIERSSPQSDTREEQVRDIIARMWVPDKEVIRDAIEDSEAIRDERIVESLVGVMWMRIVGHDPSYFLVDLLIHAMEAQGMSVEQIEEGYRLRWPDSQYTRIVPYTVYN